MSLFQRIFVLVLSISTLESQAARVIPVAGNEGECGSFTYFTGTRSFQTLSEFDQKAPLPILKTKGRKSGLKLSEEHLALETFLNNQISHFEKNGDRAFENRTICYGIFNDEVMNGNDSWVFEDKTMLIGIGKLKVESREQTHYFEWARLLQGIYGMRFQLDAVTPEFRNLHAHCVAGFLRRIDEHRGANHKSAESAPAIRTPRWEAFEAGQYMATSIHQSDYWKEGRKLRGYLENEKAWNLNNIDSAFVLGQCGKYYQ